MLPNTGSVCHYATFWQQKVQFSLLIYGQLWFSHFRAIGLTNFDVSHLTSFCCFSSYSVLSHPLIFPKPIFYSCWKESTVGVNFVGWSLQIYFYCLILVQCLILGANLSFVTTVMRRVLQSRSLTWAIRGCICSVKPCAVETRAASKIWFAYECQMTFYFMLGWSNFWPVPWSESKDIKPLKLEGRWVMLKQVIWQAHDWHQACEAPFNLHVC